MISKFNGHPIVGGYLEVLGKDGKVYQVTASELNVYNDAEDMSRDIVPILSKYLELGEYEMAEKLIEMVKVSEKRNKFGYLDWNIPQELM